MYILHLEQERYPAPALAQLAQAGTVHYTGANSQQALQEAAGRAPYTAVFTRLGLMLDAKVLAAMPQLQYVVTPTTGHNHLDLAALEQRGIQLISLKGHTAFLDRIASTAEHTWALLLALLRHLPAAHASVQQGQWQRAPFLAHELEGRRLGILGLGRLGRMVARYAHAFGMEVWAHDVDEAAYAACPTPHKAVGLETLLKECPILSLHIPYTPANQNFINAQRLALMPKGAMLINTARGEVVDEAALLQALQSGHLGGAGVDVLWHDSGWHAQVPQGHHLVAYAQQHHNLLITPHMGGYGRSSIERTRQYVTDLFLQAVGQV